MALIILPVAHVDILSILTFSTALSFAVNPFSNIDVFSIVHGQFTYTMGLAIFVKLSWIVLTLSQLSLFIALSVLINIERKAEIINLWMGSSFLIYVFLNSIYLLLYSIFLFLDLLLVRELS